MTVKDGFSSNTPLIKGENYVEIMSRLLARTNTSSDIWEMSQQTVEIIRECMGIHAVAIRLYQDGNYIHAESPQLPDLFIGGGVYDCKKDVDDKAKEKKCSLFDCICSRVISGITDPLQPYFTSRGSFWTKNFTEIIPLIKQINECDQACAKCLKNEFQSVAMVPLVNGLEIVGVLQLFDRRREIITEEMIALVEKIASSIGVALRKTWVEHALRENTMRLEKILVEIENNQKLKTHSERLNALGQMAASIAHDFNNILMNIGGFAELVVMSVPPGSEASDCLGHILSATKRASDIVSQILIFSGRQEQARVPLKIQSVIKDTVKLLRSGIPSTIKIKTEINKDCPFVLSRPTQIHQILANLATNAYHAMKKKGGVIHINLEECTPSDNFFSAHPNCSTGKYVRLRVTDSGCGMNKATLARIFEPYFSTKQQGEGTGLGLSIVYDIVKEMDGTIEV